jgi:hypothetical protein
MRTTRLAKLLTISGAFFSLATIPGFADPAQCRHVGGGVLTNFLLPGDCAGSFQNVCTDGTATGDLRGSVGVGILGLLSQLFKSGREEYPQRMQHVFASIVNGRGR